METCLLHSLSDEEYLEILLGALLAVVTDEVWQRFCMLSIQRDSTFLWLAALRTGISERVHLE